MKVNRIAAAVLGMQMLIGVAAIPALAAGKSQTLTGEVSDAMCGAKHEMPGNAAACTRGCVKHGSQYALVVGDKVYTLQTSDQAALDKLNDLAGAKAKVTGDVNGDTITVKSVAAGS
ncbi:MAG TPA: hypothetical protein VK828_01990 [Terriglobales bacterium]|jgi:hypothetical protein|nr:hypothetical protein [Terriglobales bacterium]